MLSASFTIVRIFVANDLINQAEFSVEFTSAETPGLKSLHGGRVSIADAQLPSSAHIDEIAVALRATYDDASWQNLEAFHTAQLKFEYETLGLTPIDIDVPVDPENGFQPLEPLDFWLIALEIGVTERSVEAEIAAMPEGKDKDRAMIYFTKAQRYRRSDPLLASLAAKQSITAEHLDALWLWGTANSKAA